MIGIIKILVLREGLWSWFIPLGGGLILFFLGEVRDSGLFFLGGGRELGKIVAGASGGVL